jgi:prepilin-type N-terminal cleavage/methylation domain-containing protein
MIHQQKRGFTLTELLVAVALLSVLILAIVGIFNQTSEIFTLTEAKINLFHNSRDVFERMSKELSSALPSTEAKEQFLINVTPAASNNANGPIQLLRFKTITSWENTNSSVAIVRYELHRVLGTNRWNLVRVIDDPAITIQGPDSARDNLTDNDFQAVIGQFINSSNDNNGLPKAKVEFLFFDSTSGVNQWKVGQPANKTFPLGKIPEVVRLTMDVQDFREKSVRTLSHTFWVASGNQSD